MTETIDLIRRRIDEVETWCAVYELWTPELEPAHCTPRGDLSFLDVAERIEAVEYVLNRRTELLQSSDGQRHRSRPASGRLLAFDPAQTIACGYSQFCSDRFFSDSDNPPWDTWLLYVDNRADVSDRTLWSTYLLCWVPARYVEKADEGIEGNPMCCIDWVSQVPGSFAKNLARLGFGA